MNITPTLKSFFEVSDGTILIVQILLMAIMSYYLKLHAPGAKTFFQVIQNSSDQNTFPIDACLLPQDTKNGLTR